MTGASSGIGAELSREFARRGARLVLVARRAERLRELAAECEGLGGERHASIAADLTRDDERARVAAEALRQTGGVDVLVNNAGLGEYGDFASQDGDVLARMMRLNMDALVQLTRACLPPMLARRRGWVLNIASMAGFQPFPYMSVYAASKSFVIRFSFGLREELRGRGVVVTCVCPGTTRTEFFDRPSFKARRDEFGRMGADAGEVARRAVRALERGRALCVPGWRNVILSVAQRVLPDRWLARWLGRFMQSPREG